MFSLCGGPAACHDIFSKESSYLHRVAGPCSQIHRPALPFTSGAAKGPKQLPCLLRTLPAPLGLLGQVAHVAEQWAQQPGPAALPSLVLGLTQSQQLFGSLSKGARVSPNEDGAASKTPEAHQALCLLHGCRGARCNSLGLTLGGISCFPALLRYDWHITLCV